MIPLRNRLGETASPYLLQHKDNPVHWYPWGEEALQAARQEDKPILLSIGYAACHWCHVMAHESFENPAIAELMNKLFINIKIDREERPDLDAIYQQALSLLGQQGGWPLTMFLLPDTQPFWGGTYFPPEARWGRPGLPEILTKIASLYRDEKEKVLSNSQQIMAAMTRLALPKAGDSIVEDMLDRIAARLLQEIDEENGGVGSAPKFPHFPILELLWRAYLRNNKIEYKEAVIAALYVMLQGGIYDHLGGGMARYAVDAAWLIPHFEKMLYDNASLLSMLAMVQADVQDPIIALRAREIVAFLDKNMSIRVKGEVGAFASSWDADSEGEEGKFYVWKKREIDHLLGEVSALFCNTYDVSEEGNWEGRNILNRLGAMSWLGEETERKLAICRMKLKEARLKRIKPGFDDKILTDWNGMAITALCKAGFVFNEPDWIALAKRAYKFLKDHLFMDGRLHHSWRNGQMGPMAHLDDQVQMAEAAFSLYEATGDEMYLSDVKARLEDLKREFRDPSGGGYFYTSIHARDILIRQKSVLDGATPNANGLLLDLLLRMEQITGEGQYREEAHILEKAFAGEIERSIFSLATYLNAIDLGYRPVSVVIYAEEEDQKKFLDICRQQFHPNLIVQCVNPGSELSPSHPAWGKTGIGNRVFICKGRVCSMPISDTEAMEQVLKSSYR